MNRFTLRLLASLSLAFLPLIAAAQALWIEGTHYEVIRPAVPTSTPGKVEVVEVFSYGCPYCNQAQPMIEKIKASLPAYATLVYVPASFIPSEGWPMLQRAYLTAQTLGIADKTHAALFDAIWKTGEFPLVDVATRRTRRPLPTLEQAAHYYAQHSAVKEADFLATARSPAVDAKVRRADELVQAYQVPGTPAIVINGKYRLGPVAAGSDQQMISLINYLVALESASVTSQKKP